MGYVVLKFVCYFHWCSLGVSLFAKYINYIKKHFVSCQNHGPFIYLFIFWEFSIGYLVLVADSKITICTCATYYDFYNYSCVSLAQ